jgi:hypothetical protein
MADEQLRNQIRQAFPPAQFYGPITPCDCEECTDIRDGLRHKRWDEISTQFLDFTCSPVLLTPEAFHAFLPAYLLRGLDDLGGDTVVREFTVYSLCPNGSEEQSHEYQNQLLQVASFMSPLQIQAGRAFLVFVQENAAHGKWFRPFVARALDGIWR